MSDRRRLNFTAEEQVLTDVAMLRRGYRQTGQWSLAQVAWHLDKAVCARMAPGPFGPNTPEQDARRSVLESVLATGRLPAINASDVLVPPANCGDEAFDALATSLMKLKAFTGQIAPHRLFGQLADADARRLNLIHCAHHLSYLVPNAPAGARS